MKRNDISALHTNSVLKLTEQLTELQTKWAKAKLQKAAGKLENLAQVKELADDIARIKTVIREKELTAVTANATAIEEEV